jgi:glutathionylspermidine synthase
VERVCVAPREDWTARVEALGFDFHTIRGAPYWDESAYWAFTADEIDVLEAAAEELHRLMLEAADAAVRDGRLGDLGIPEGVHGLVAESWRRFRAGEGEAPLYGRFDVSWAGEGPPKLLEYNADTPTALFEAAVVQWQWLEDVAPDADQFNSVHERLVERWPLLAPGDGTPLHLACLVPHGEDEGTTRYLEATAIEAGLRAKFAPIDRVAWDAAAGRFLDQDDDAIAWLFKLYPWEWLLREAFAEPLAAQLAAGRLRVVEPLWKLMLTGKGILALLWEMFPGHPNLLPAFRTPDGFEPGAEVVAKPLFGREGANVSVAVLGPDRRPAGPPLIETDGPYGGEGFVFQAWHPVAAATGADGRRHHAVLGLWMVGDVACGLGIREDDGPVTRDSSRFVPHLFR